jgi:hypothetical protein
MSDYTQKKIMTIKRFSWCGGCGYRTEQEKIHAGAWLCPCGAHLQANGMLIAEHKPQEAEKAMAVTCPA